MKLNKNLRAILAIFFIALISTNARPSEAAADMEGTRDFEDLPRVEGTYIAGYRYGEYDIGTFIKSFNAGNPTFVEAEGQRTRILYIGTETQTSIQLLRNYQRAFADFGDYSEQASCRGDDCWKNLAKDLVWSKANRIPVSFRNPGSLYNLKGNEQSPVYAYGTISRGDRFLHVSAFSTVITYGGTTGIRNVPLLHLEIVEIENFEPSLVSVKAEEMIQAIHEDGSIALHGIQFELDSDEITGTSAATIDEIARLLNTETDLSVYVVGHTDSSGAFAHNQALSQARAAAVAEALSTSHGIDPARLIPVGVGPVAPMASNDEEAGRSLNRRVQIVKR